MGVDGTAVLGTAAPCLPPGTSWTTSEQLFLFG